MKDVIAHSLVKMGKEFIHCSQSVRLICDV